MDIKVVCDDEKYLPQYANDTDACMDLKVVVPKGEFVLCPGHSKVFQTGIKVSVPENHVMMMFLRSSAGIKGKLTLMNGTGIIDSGYRDEVKLAIKNNRPVKIIKITEYGKDFFETSYEKLIPHHKLVEEKIANTDLSKVGELLRELREVLEETIDIDI